MYPISSLDLSCTLFIFKSDKGYLDTFDHSFSPLGIDTMFTKENFEN